LSAQRRTSGSFASNSSGYPCASTGKSTSRYGSQAQRIAPSASAYCSRAHRQGRPSPARWHRLCGQTRRGRIAHPGLAGVAAASGDNYHRRGGCFARERRDRAPRSPGFHEGRGPAARPMANVSRVTTPYSLRRLPALRP
jgi:hypothetical protein